MSLWLSTNKTYSSSEQAPQYPRQLQIGKTSVFDYEIYEIIEVGKDKWWQICTRKQWLAEQVILLSGHHGTNKIIRYCYSGVKKCDTLGEQGVPDISGGVAVTV